MKKYIEMLFKNRLIVLTIQLITIAMLALPGVAFPASVVLDWDPSTDADLAGYKVYYQANSSALPFAGSGAAEGSAPIDVANTLTTTVAGLDPGNSYFFAVTAYNSAGLESVYSNVIEIPEAVSPTLAISSPANNASVNGTVLIGVSASDNKGVSSVEFYLNGVLQSTDTAAPYQFSWDTSSLTSGLYTIMAKGYDAAGNQGQSEVLVTVVGDTAAPTVALIEPDNNVSVSGNLTITATASDDTGVSRIEIYDNGILTFASNQNPTSYNWNTLLQANGSHILTAKAYDAAGNIGESANVVVTVVNDFSAPSVVIGSPANGSTIGGMVTFFANAVDNIGVTKVEFFVNGNLLSTATGAPFSFNWNTFKVVNGSSTLTAKAYDAAGNIGQAQIVVNVFNDMAAPIVTAFSLPGTLNSTTVHVASFSATDNVGVAGYLITESASVPSASAAGWSATAPTSFTFAGTGSRTAYAWAKDAVGNVSTANAAAVLIDSVLPIISSMSLASGASSVTIKATATDNVAVTKMELYLDNALQLETSNSSFTYVWSVSFKRSQAITVKVYDAAGNVRLQSFKVSKI